MADKPEARHLTEMLRRHYQPDNRPPAGVFAPEIGSPDGKRRADVIWLPTTIAGGKGLHGHEIKVSRSDLLAELADPTKADPWSKYCTRWWLVVVNEGIVSGLDIPEAWGVMAPPSGRRTRSMTVVKPAPKLAPHDAAPGLQRLAAWMLHQHHDRVGQVEHELAYLRRENDRLKRDLAAAQASGVTSAPAAEKVARIVQAVEQRLQGEHVWSDTSEQAVVDAIVDRAATADAASSVRREMDQLVREVGRVVEPFRATLRDLERAKKLATDLARGGGTDA